MRAYISCRVKNPSNIDWDINEILCGLDKGNDIVPIYHLKGVLPEDVIDLDGEDLGNGHTTSRKKLERNLDKVMEKLSKLVGGRVVSRKERGKWERWEGCVVTENTFGGKLTGQFYAVIGHNPW